MSDLLKDIEEYLIAAGVGIADGVDLFRDRVPDSPDTVIVLSEYVGSSASHGISVTDRSVQVITRATTYAAAKLKCWDVYKALVDIGDPIKTISASRWGIIHGRSTPRKLEDDAQMRTLFFFNIGITTQGD